jgi:hypothetical protein
MNIVINLLFWLHLMALAMGLGGGIGMSQVGPRLVKATPEDREKLFPLASAYNRISTIGLVLLLVTGPAVLWLKFGGFQGMNHWFMLKMALVLVVIVAMGLAHAGLARLKRGDEKGGKLMMIAGPITALTTAGVVLAAVFAFN